MDIKRGDIFYIERGGISVGSEQNSGRPAVIVSNDKNNKYSSTVEVIYFTTQPKTDLPTHVSIHSCSKTSIALCEQITTVAKERIGDYVRHVTKKEMANIEIAILVSLDLYLPNSDDEIQDDSSEDEPYTDLDGYRSRIIQLEKRVEKSDMECHMLRKLYESLLDKLVAAK